MIESFSCVNLRCFEKKEFLFEKEFTLIEGENGTGKTTVLEGIYLSIRGKSFLTGKIRNLVKFDSDFLRVKSVIEGNNIDVFFSERKGKKEVLLNSKSINSSKISLIFPLFILNGRFLNFIRTDIVTLYKFFNIILSLYDKGYLNVYGEYIKALKQKRHLLTLERKNDTINAWNLILLERSKIIREKRKKFVKKINRILNKDVFVSYKEHSINDNDKFVFERELKEKRILTGCHRDRFFIFKKDKDMRFFYSSGQQKNIFFEVLSAIGLIFADKTGKKPILLLDDFDSELDLKNLNYCLERVIDKFQVILTTTDKKRYSNFDYNLISL